MDNVLLAFEYLPNRGDNDKANIVFDCYVDSHVMIAPSSPINGKASDYDDPDEFEGVVRENKVFLKWVNGDRSTKVMGLIGVPLLKGDVTITRIEKDDEYEYRLIKVIFKKLPKFMKKMVR
ncbi:MAG: hypothetical protein RPS47_05925 [Colwellia sp.]